MKFILWFLKNNMLHDLLKFHFFILFHITFICTLYDFVLPNKYLAIYLSVLCNYVQHLTKVSEALRNNNCWQLVERMDSQSDTEV